MGTTIRSLLFGLLCVIGILGAGPAAAGDLASRSDSAVADILFDYDADEFASYSVRDDGYVDINFASNVPEGLYSKILNELQNDPNIPGVLAGKTGPTCSLFIVR